MHWFGRPAACAAGSVVRFGVELQGAAVRHRGHDVVDGRN